MRLRGSICVLALVLAAGMGQAQTEPVSRERWLEHLNQERLRIAAPPLRLSSALIQAAQEQAEAMVLGGRDLRSPSGPAVSALLLRVGYPAYDWSEAYTLSAAAAACPNRIAPEPSLRGDPFGPALAGPFQELGIGVAYARGSLLQVFLFGRRQDDFFTQATAGLTDRGRVERELLILLNEERWRGGLDPLALHPLLTRAAQDHADDMLARGYSGHASPDGKGPMERARAAGYGGGTAGGGMSAIGENIAEQRFTPREVLQAWLESPPHRRNLLDPEFREMGLGLALGEGPKAAPRSHRAIWVLDLASRVARRKPAASAPTEIDLLAVEVRGVADRRPSPLD